MSLRVDLAARPVTPTTGRAAHALTMAITRCATVVESSLGVSPGDRYDGPPIAYLLAVCEPLAGEGDANRVAAAALDTFVRSLLREESLTEDVSEGRAAAAKATLRAAAETAARTVENFGEAPAGEERLPVSASLTAALLREDRLFLAHSGDTAAVIVAGGRARPVTTPQANAAIETLDHRLEADETLVLTTGDLRSVFDGELPPGAAPREGESAAAYAERLLRESGALEHAAVVVAKYGVANDEPPAMVAREAEEEAPAPTAVKVTAPSPAPEPKAAAAPS